MSVKTHVTQCCSCLFVSGRTVVYRSHYKRPQFVPKIDFGGPNYSLQRLMLRLMLTGPAVLCPAVLCWRLERPSRTPSTCVAWQLQHWCYCFIVVLWIYISVKLFTLFNCLRFFVFENNNCVALWLYQCISSPLLLQSTSVYFSMSIWCVVYPFKFIHR